MVYNNIKHKNSGAVNKDFLILRDWAIKNDLGHEFKKIDKHLAICEYPLEIKIAAEIGKTLLVKRPNQKKGKNQKGTINISRFI